MIYDSTHVWYPSWLYHRKSIHCPKRWKNSFSAFARWLSAQNYAPHYGDKLIMNPHREWGFFPHIIRKGEIPYEGVRGKMLAKERPLSNPAARNQSTHYLTLSGPVYLETSPVEWHWTDMHQKCYNPKHPYYEAVGQEGIEVCVSWHVFNNFAKWVYDEREGYEVNAPLNQSELIRIDRELDYSPFNCVFVRRD